MYIDGYDVKTHTVLPNIRAWSPISTVSAPPGDTLSCTGRRNRAASSSSLGDTDGSSDVSGRVLMDTMSKLTRYCPTHVCGAELRRCQHPRGTLSCTGRRDRA
eukprot:3925114-Prymnesium_polylepis.1